MFVKILIYNFQYFKLEYNVSTYLYMYRTHEKIKSLWGGEMNDISFTRPSVTRENLRVLVVSLV